MEPSRDQFTDFLSVRSVLAAFALLAVMAFASGVVFAADKSAHVDRTELRIQDMHTKLNITAAQEEQWTKVTEAMRDNAKVMDTLTQARMEHAKEMTAVDDLKSYGEIAAAHADGIKKLTPVFADLYASMSEPQRKEADALFRHGPRKHADRKGRAK
jgi:hypothetical protein